MPSPLGCSPVVCSCRWWVRVLEPGLKGNGSPSRRQWRGDGDMCPGSRLLCVFFINDQTQASPFPWASRDGSVVAGVVCFLRRGDQVQCRLPVGSERSSQPSSRESASIVYRCDALWSRAREQGALLGGREGLGLLLHPVELLFVFVLNALADLLLPPLRFRPLEPIGGGIILCSMSLFLSLCVCRALRCKLFDQHPCTFRPFGALLIQSRELLCLLSRKVFLACVSRLMSMHNHIKGAKGWWTDDWDETVYMQFVWIINMISYLRPS
jgi:hypothetical protein